MIRPRSRGIFIGSTCGLVRESAGASGDHLNPGNAESLGVPFQRVDRNDNAPLPPRDRPIRSFKYICRAEGIPENPSLYRDKRKGNTFGGDGIVIPSSGTPGRIAQVDPDHPGTYCGILIEPRRKTLVFLQLLRFLVEGILTVFIPIPDPGVYGGKMDSSVEVISEAAGMMKECQREPEIIAFRLFGWRGHRNQTANALDSNLVL